MYSISGYGRMIADQSRLAAHTAALKYAVKPGSVVADIGTGPGLFALVACQLGARRVYAIEPDDVIQVAREVAAVNGFTDRIEFIQDYSTDVTLPEPVDVIISDLRGVLPWFGHHLPAIQDARSRLLAPEGILIPQRDTLWAAPVEVDATYEKLVGPWSNGKHNVVLTPALNRVTNIWSKARINAEELLGEPICWHTLDYCQIQDVNVQATIEMIITRRGTAHGFAIWFDCELVDDIGFSNRPGSDQLIYGNAFFPFPEPVDVDTGDKIWVKVRADLVRQDYIWQWETSIRRTKESINGSVFKQSTFFGTPLSRTEIQKRAAIFVPTLSTSGEIDRLILSKMDGKTSLEEIARQLVKQFPDRFDDFAGALDLVADISARYSK